MLDLILTPVERDWRSAANCLEVDPESMQPEVATPEDVQLAKRVCIGCPVRTECREMARNQPGGAYGIHDGTWYGEEPRLPERECEHCGALFPVQRSTARFCSAAHRQAAGRAARREASLAGTA